MKDPKAEKHSMSDYYWFARLCARAAVVMIVVGAALSFKTALRQLSYPATDIPYAEFHKAFVIWLLIAVALSDISYGLWKLRRWDWGISLAISGFLTLFYALNCLQFRWFFWYLAAFPLTLTLITLAFPAFRVEWTENEKGAKKTIPGSH